MSLDTRPAHQGPESHHRDHHAEPAEDPLAFWERRYGDVGKVWSGKVNRSLADAVADLAPGRSLDLGCGEGGDVLWLASRGWQATGIDLSATAVERARQEAAERGLKATFVAADLGQWARDPGHIEGSAGSFELESFDLITASFLQSPVELPREQILRAAAGRVAPGGRLVVLSHAAPPPWAEGLASGHGDFPTPQSELALLGLDPELWEVTAEIRTREAAGPAGTPYEGRLATLDDTLVVARRR